ncbi:hypothetical protein [Streptomyces sp. AK02-04a]|uniref:hypothetical protein n=1 Tax=Streptomyces sp. AK02-04a TaxID=3028649 RepID=UPI0029A8CBF5|nr:hypothetical protein [Streptomyces sp. AK02-04a]MDX3763232.1 hypothetical protein [Streptomyces sp. AK02-04a]
MGSTAGKNVLDVVDGGGIDGRQADVDHSGDPGPGRPAGAINRLQLDDLDIDNRWLIVDGRVRTLDKLTLQAAPPC